MAVLNLPQISAHTTNPKPSQMHLEMQGIGKKSSDVMKQKYSKQTPSRYCRTFHGTSHREAIPKRDLRLHWKSWQLKPAARFILVAN